MRISIFGLGYVGAVTGACLASCGHTVIGVDVSKQKVESFAGGKPSIIEPGLDELLKFAYDKGLLQATTICDKAVAQSDVSIVCVGTPSAACGSLDLSYVKDVTKQLAEAIRRKGSKHRIVFRSTMLPGSTDSMVREYLQDLLDAGMVEVFYFPEFLRESTAVKDFKNPSLVVVGTRDGNPPPGDMASLFGVHPNVVKWNAAELVKYGCNTFHAVKLTFANEIGRIGKELGLDAQSVMRILCEDKKLNISSVYMRPGNPFGGSCLPKDVRALTDCARRHGVSLPMIENLIPSNTQHLASLLKMVEAAGSKVVTILGLSFKSNTDDLRESPMVEVAQILLGRGYQLKIYDPQLNLAALIGSNKRLIDVKMPHLASLLCGSLKEAVRDEGTVIASQPCVKIDELRSALTDKHLLIDVNGWPDLQSLPNRVEGFCW